MKYRQTHLVSELTIQQRWIFGKLSYQTIANFFACSSDQLESGMSIDVHYTTADLALIFKLSDSSFSQEYLPITVCNDQEIFWDKMRRLHASLTLESERFFRE